MTSFVRFSLFSPLFFIFFRFRVRVVLSLSSLQTSPSSSLLFLGQLRVERGEVIRYKTARNVHSEVSSDVVLCGLRFRSILVTFEKRALLSGIFFLRGENENGKKKKRRAQHIYWYIVRMDYIVAV